MQIWCRDAEAVPLTRNSFSSLETYSASSPDINNIGTIEIAEFCSVTSQSQQSNCPWSEDLARQLNRDGIGSKRKARRQNWNCIRSKSPELIRICMNDFAEKIKWIINEMEKKECGGLKRGGILVFLIHVGDAIRHWGIGATFDSCIYHEIFSAVFATFVRLWWWNVEQKGNIDSNLN